MGTLYDLLGALPGDDAEELRAAFRKAAKTTHPDVNPDDPEASLRFRELVRAYDILKDDEQRTTYDDLLAIALQPPAAKSARVYESVRKFATNTMAATVIAGVMVGGYTLFGHFSKPPGAAELLAGTAANGAERTDAAEPETEIVASAESEPEVSRVEVPAEDTAAAEPANAAGEAGTEIVAALDPVEEFAGTDLLIRHDPRVIKVYDRGIALYRMREFDHAMARMTPTTPTPIPNPRKASASPPHRPPTARHSATPARPVRITAAVTP